MKRFNIIKKSRKKSKDIDEKIEYLNKECQKTGLQEVMTTIGMYSVQGSEPNPSHNAFKSLSHDGQPLGFSGADFNIFTEPIGGLKYSPPHPVTGERQRASSWFGIASGFGPVSANSDRQILWIFDQSLAGGFGRYFSLELTGGSNPFWGTWISTAFGTEMLVPYNSNNSPLSDNIKNNLNNLNINNFRNPDDFGSPTNPVLFKNDLGDPSHLPINIDGMSPQSFDSLLDKAIATKYKTEDEMWDAMIKFLEDDAGQNPADDPFTRKGSGMGDRWIGPPVDRADYKLEGQTLSEGVKLGNFDPEVLNVDINDIRKGIMPEFPKDPPPEMINGYSAKSRLVPKKVEGTPFIKVTRKDLVKNHILTDKEIGEFLFKVNLINEYIKENPAELIYAMTRYPKHDPRLAQLNFQMDRMKAASDQYMDTHFPENQKLFNKLQDKIIRNIKQTDPINFKGHKEAPKFTDDDIEMSEQRKQIVSKYFKKPVKIKKLFKR